jgi:predicted amidohydrolase YtcJ
VSTLVLRQAEVDGVVVDVRIDGAEVAALGPPGTMDRGDEEIACGGGALLPGLHDHHLHLLAMAAALESIDVGVDLDRAIRAAHGATAPGSWIRAVNYDEASGGPLDRWRLDALAPGRPVRVQHRSGAMWVLSSTALDQIGAEPSREDGVERDRSGSPTGRLFRLDAWLGERVPHDLGGGLAAVGRRLAGFGVTGVTDCTPTADMEYFETVAEAVRAGDLPVTVSTTGGPELAEAPPPAPLRRGPVKIVITDHEFPLLDDLTAWYRRAHRAGRPVAVHCVTRAALVLALAAWEISGSIRGDRVEHASITPPELATVMAELGVTVVTQPAFLTARGDSYLEDVDAADRADLYRCASLMQAGIPVGGSTDAPYGPDDPWTAITAAIERRAPSGTPVGIDTGLEPASALNLFLGTLERPGGRARHVRPGVPADLCLLGVPLRTALLGPSSRHVALTIAGGRRTFPE